MFPAVFPCLSPYVSPALVAHLLFSPVILMNFKMIPRGGRKSPGVPWSCLPSRKDTAFPYRTCNTRRADRPADESPLKTQNLHSSNRVRAEMESVDGGHGSAKAAHVLVIPLSSQGHIAPLLRLATQLARKGVTVTFVSTEEAFSRLTAADEGLSSELESLDFRFLALPLEPDERQNEAGGSVYLSARYREAFKPVQEKLLRDKSAGIAGATSLISDMFLPWTQNVADELHIPRYMLVTSGVIFARSLQAHVKYFESGQFQISPTDGKLLEFDWPVCIPGLPPLRFCELPRGLRDYPVEYRVRSESMRLAAGVLVNSFLELEEKVAQVWKSSEQSVPKLYPVGPLFSTSSLPTIENIQGSDDSNSQCLRWLHSQPPSSVLYVAFGSMFRLQQENIQELAHGLEASKQRFLWVLPQAKGGSGGEKAPSVTEALPHGFEARVGDRGFILTGWAPQLQILAHPATACFLTHSGWNSSLESIILGVPMISWPQGAEQHLNCRYLADDLKVAAQLQTGAANVLKREEVERVVRLLMVEEEGKAIKNRIEEFQRKAAAAVAQGGSRSKAFLDFSEDVRHDAASEGK